MFTDLNLKLATALSVAADGLGDEAAVDLAAGGSVRDILTYGGDPGHARTLAMVITCKAAISTLGSPTNSVRFDLISSPLITSGGLLKLQDATVDAGTNDIFTIDDGHSFGVGSPLTFSGVGGGIGFSTGTTYYAIPLTDTTFKIAGTVAGAFAGTAVDVTGAATNATLDVVPTIHAQIEVQARQLAQVGNQIVVPCRPLTKGPGKDYAATGASRPWPGGIARTGASGEMHVAQRYLGVRVDQTGTTTSGTVDVELVLTGSHGQQFFTSGMEVL